MIKLFKPVFFSFFALSVIFSCTQRTPDQPNSRKYVNVTVDDGSSYYFTDDSGKTYYPADVSRIETYPEDDTENGNRALIWFNTLQSGREGFDYDIALYGVMDILTKTVEVALTEEDVENAGGDPLEIKHISLSGNWLDIRFILHTDGKQETIHKMTLLDNTLATVPEQLPADYQYLEFRHSGNNKNENILGIGNVSYDLGEYAPSVSEKKGLYIRINSLEGRVRHVRIDYNAPKGNTAFSDSFALPADNLSIR